MPLDDGLVGTSFRISNLQRARIAPSESHARPTSPFTCRLYVPGRSTLFLRRPCWRVGLYRIYGPVFRSAIRDAANGADLEYFGRQLCILSLGVGRLFPSASRVAIVAVRLAVRVYWRRRRAARRILSRHRGHCAHSVGPQDVLGGTYLCRP